MQLKPDGSPVKLYNGDIKEENVHEAVIDMEIGSQDLQQCADAVMRLRGEYLYQQGRYSEISFTFNNGFKAEYSRWMQGERIILNGKEHHWEKRKEPSNTYADFRKYMDEVFSFAGSLSLSKMLKSKPLSQIRIGDVLIIGGSPGHAETVMDMATDTLGNKIFMLAQSYMPAQEIHILKNEAYPQNSPWYFASNVNYEINTPERDFNKDQLKGW